jgi:hypothetical protein
MDPKVAKSLEREIEKAIIEVICRMGLKKLPLLPAHRTMTTIAKAAVAVYKAADEASPEKPESPYSLYRGESPCPS